MTRFLALLPLFICLISCEKSFNNQDTDEVEKFEKDIKSNNSNL